MVNNLGVLFSQQKYVALHDSGEVWEGVLQQFSLIMVLPIWTPIWGNIIIHLLRNGFKLQFKDIMW